MAAPVSISFSPVPGWLKPGVSNHHMAALSPVPACFQAGVTAVPVSPHPFP